MQRTDDSAKAGKVHVERRSRWQSPTVRKMRAGMAEVSFTNTVDDGPATKS